MNKLKNNFTVIKYFTFDSKKMIIFSLLPSIDFCRDNRSYCFIYNISLYWLFFEIAFSYTKFKV